MAARRRMRVLAGEFVSPGVVDNAWYGAGRKTQGPSCRGYERGCAAGGSGGGRIPDDRGRMPLLPHWVDRKLAAARAFTAQTRCLGGKRLHAIYGRGTREGGIQGVLRSYARNPGDVVVC